MGWLRLYDPGIVRADFARIAAADMDTVRIFLLWDHIQPSIDTIDSACLVNVVDVANAADEAGVELIVTLFTGHMSGVNWIPEWATGGNDGDARFRVVSGGQVHPHPLVLRNWYDEDEIVDAQVLLASGVAAALAGHPSVWAWDLGNENSNCTIPPDAAAADRWLERMTAALRTADPGSLVTVGVHMEDIESDRLIGPTESAVWCDFVCMHGYPIYADWSSGPTDERLVPFLTELTGWLAGKTPVLFEEFGLPTAEPGGPPKGVYVTEAEAARYAGQTLDGIRVAGGIGALLWCYADYSSARYEEPPLDVAVHERSFGLWRADHTAKPAVAEISSRSGQACLATPDVNRWLDVTVDEFKADRRRQLVRLYRRYCSA